MNKHGQSIIEYSMIAVLVILGVYIMGPYVLRSIGAHFKIWDDGIKDSFEENLTQAPPGDVPTINVGCTCQTSDNGCGSTQAGVQCQDPTEHGYTMTCQPIGCNGDPRSWCIIDPKCCTAWANVSCGTVPLPEDSSGNVITSPINGPASPPANDNCYYGDELQSQQCGSNPSVQCVPATASENCQLPQCQGNLGPGQLFCATNSTSQPQGLNTDYNVGNPLASAAACPSNPTCQAYCDTANSYTLSANGTTCVLPGPPPAFQCLGNTCTGVQVSTTSSCYNSFPGTWTGYYNSTPGNPSNPSTQGNEYITVSCGGQNGSVGGICFTPNEKNANGTGSQGYCPTSPTPGAIYCQQSVSFYFQYYNNASPWPVNINCSPSNQLTSIIDDDPTALNQNITPAATNGCNWSGTIDVYALQSGNDMYLTCDTSSGQGVLTQFIYAPHG